MAGTVYAADSRCDLDAFQKLVARKVELRRALAEEKASWERQKNELERESSLLARELERLQRELAAERQIRDKAGADFAVSMKKKDALEKSMGAVRQHVAGAEDDINVLLAQVPEPLKSEKLKLFSVDLASDDSGPQQLRHVLGVLDEIEQLENSAHAVRQMLEINGKRRAMDVVYLGLAQGYAVASDDSVAAVGKPGDAGWQWRRVSGIERDVRRLFDVKSGKIEPQTVVLPLQGPFKEVQP